MIEFRGSTVLHVLCAQCRTYIAMVQRLPGSEGDIWVKAHPQPEGLGFHKAVADAKRHLGGRVPLPGQTTRLDHVPPATVSARCPNCERTVECAVPDVVAAYKANLRRTKRKPLLV